MTVFNPSTDAKWAVWEPISSVNTSHEVVAGGCFLPQGTSTPIQRSTVSSNAASEHTIGGSFWEVSRIAAGRFLVTLIAQDWDTGTVKPLSTSVILNLRVSLQMHTTTNLNVSVSSINVANGTFEIDVVNPSTGVLTDISANANNAIFWHIHQSLGGPSSISNI